MTVNKYCADLQGGLWFQYNSANSSWYAKPCCLYKKTYKVKSDIKVEFWDHAEIIKNRQDNLRGEALPIECASCEKTEANGNYSRRQAWNERLGTNWEMPESIIELDIHVDFTCNLACRICGPELSTKWRQISATPENGQVKKFKVRANSINTADIISTIPTHNLQQIHFQGGEPFLTNAHLDLLEKLERTVDVSQIIVWYHSNGTVRVPEKVLKFWEKFKMVEIYFSLDDLGPRMEYQRWPIIWDEVHENMLWYRENLPHNGLLRVERAVGVLNAYWIDELENWCSQHFTKTKYTDDITLNYHTCFGPFGLGAMSTEYITAILDKLPETHWVYKTVKPYINKENPAAIVFMLAELDKHDAIRGQNWRKTYPEFLEWYKRYL